MNSQNLGKWARQWSMPSHETFDCPPIRSLVKRYISRSTCSVDPFSRNKHWTTFTNDIDPSTSADSHLDAFDFMEALYKNGITPDLVLFDPPYSPRQISEHYRYIGKKATKLDTSNVRRLNDRKLIAKMQSSGGIVISFGWNSTGMGKVLGYEIIEGLLVNHGGSHHDTICVVERKI